MALSPRNNPIRLSNAARKVIIDIGNRELYLIATFQHLGLLYFAFGAATRSVIATPLLRR